MATIKEYMQYVDKRRFKSNNISAHIYDPKMQQNIVLFGYFKEENLIGDNIPCCHALYSRSQKYSDYNSVEITTIEIDSLSEVYSDCEIVYDSQYLNKHYKTVMKEFEQMTVLE